MDFVRICVKMFKRWPAGVSFELREGPIVANQSSSKCVNGRPFGWLTRTSPGMNTFCFGSWSELGLGLDS